MRDDALAELRKNKTSRCYAKTHRELDFTARQLWTNILRPLLYFTAYQSAKRSINHVSCKNMYAAKRGVPFHYKMHKLLA